MNKKAFTIISICILFASCGSKKKSLEIEDLATAKVVAMHYNSEPQFKTINSRLRLKYQDQDRSQSVTISFRMRKDSAIWMSAQVLGIPLAKALITKDRVSYYEKIGKTYFDGDFSLLSQWLGTPLDYQKLQNLLIGQSIYDLREQRYKLTESARGYQMVPSLELGIIKKIFLMDSKTFRATAQQLSQEKESRNVTVTYSKYERIENQIFPEEIKIIANENTKSTQIDILYRSVSFDDPVSFPFEIPAGYDEIVIE